MKNKKKSIEKSRENNLRIIERGNREIGIIQIPNHGKNNNLTFRILFNRKKNKK